MAQSVSTYLIKSAGSGMTSFGGQTGITHVRVGAYTVPTDSRGQGLGLLHGTARRALCPCLGSV